MNGNYERYQAIDDVEIVDGDFGIPKDAITRGQMGSSLLSLSRGRMAQKMELAYELSNSRAVLTRQALQNIATLSHAEEVLSQVAPSGSARYRAIVDAATMSDVLTIASLRG